MRGHSQQAPWLRDSNLIARRIATIRHVCCASPSFLDRHGRPHSPEDLAALPGIRYSNVEESRQWSFAGGRSPTVKSQLYLANGDAVREAGIAGLGVIVLPTFIVHEAVRRGELEIILRDYMRPPHGHVRRAPPRPRRCRQGCAPSLTF
ncbi:substrate binding domain-containing protein [Stenotrophomonas geniculata]|uniref:substrate binding domain-containing protein n=1 Tax=Stenotrophomonas geniculata TaxID=86188 RepID=UPI003CE52B57